MTVLIRPLRDDDVSAVDAVAYGALADLGHRFGFSMGPDTPERRVWGERRIRHLAATDPAGCVVAELDGEPVGVGLSLRRSSLWFLSLLTVRQGLQGSGIGRRLLDATLAYAEGCEAAMICASPDPKALRRYGRGGFALHAGYEAVGTPARDEMPAGLGVRDGDWDRDADLVEELVVRHRGAPYGPDLAFWKGGDTRLLVVDGPTPADRAVALGRGRKLGTVAGASEQAAARVLWAALADAEPGTEVAVGYLTGSQQWAIEVALAAGLRLKLTSTLCTRGTIGPSSPYLPSGVLG